MHLADATAAFAKNYASVAVHVASTAKDANGKREGSEEKKF
jgi:hypothetical protein